MLYGVKPLKKNTRFVLSAKFSSVVQIWNETSRFIYMLCPEVVALNALRAALLQIPFQPCRPASAMQLQVSLHVTWFLYKQGSVNCAEEI